MPEFKGSGIRVEGDKRWVRGSILIGGGGHAKVLMSTLMEVGIGIGGI